MVDQQNKPRKIILLIDLDGVCTDWYGQLYGALVKKFPWDDIPTVDELTGYFWEGSFDPKYHTYIEATCEAKGFYRNLTPYPDAITALKDIEANCLGFIDPWICTKPSSGYEDYLCHSEKIQWVAEHFGAFWVKRTILTPDKTLVMADYLIDDHPYINGVNPNPTWKQILYAQPYNKETHCEYVLTWDKWIVLKDLLKRTSRTSVGLPVPTPKSTQLLKELVQEVEEDVDMGAVTTHFRKVLMDSREYLSLNKGD